MSSWGSRFEFATSQRIVFGPGEAAGLADVMVELGSTRIFVCTGATPHRHATLVAALPGTIDVFRVGGEPTVETVQEAVAVASRFGADAVVAIGGGSVIDTGKAVAMLLTNGGEPLDYLEGIGAGKTITRASLAMVAVPTTAGTGAEVTRNAVLGSPADCRKISLRSPLMLPSVALVDPVLTHGCPPAVTAASGLDALTQCLESMVSLHSSPMTAPLAAEGLRRGAAGMRAAYLDGTNADARRDMALCGLLSGVSLANSNLGAVHGFAGVIGGMGAATHGAICASLLAPVVEHNVRALRDRCPDSPALGQYADAARLLTCDASADIDAGVRWIRETIHVLRVPSLGECGVGRSDVPRLAAAARGASSMRGNPVELTDDELESILAEAIG